MVGFRNNPDGVVAYAATEHVEAAGIGAHVGLLAVRAVLIRTRPANRGPNSRVNSRVPLLTTQRWPVLRSIATATGELPTGTRSSLPSLRTSTSTLRVLSATQASPPGPTTRPAGVPPVVRAIGPRTLIPPANRSVE